MVWLKQNWFKLCIIIILLILSSIVSYYYIHILPVQNNIQNQEKLSQIEKDTIFNKNIDCQKYDQKIKDTEDSRDSKTEQVVKKGDAQVDFSKYITLGKGLFGMSVMSGVFYSPKINSCLYAGLSWRDNIEIKDALTGQVVFSEELKEMKHGTVGEEIKFKVEEYRIK